MWRLDILLIVFLVLKIGGLVDWSWWLILSPGIVPFMIGIILGLINRNRKNNHNDFSA